VDRTIVSHINPLSSSQIQMGNAAVAPLQNNIDCRMMPLVGIPNAATVKKLLRTKELAEELSNL
jgi:hypothetical protein